MKQGLPRLRYTTGVLVSWTYFILAFIFLCIKDVTFIDPAVASGPLITTVNDLVAVVTYYGLSWIFLLQIMHLAG